MRETFRPETGPEAGTLGAAVEHGARWLAYASGACLFFIVVLTCASIIGRAMLTLGLGFGPVPGDFELVEIAAGVGVFLFLPLCQLKRGHVTVDILSGWFGRWGVAVSDLIGNLLMSIAAGVILWRLIAGLQDKLGTGEESFILGIPVWSGYALSLVGAVSFLLVCLYTLYRSWAETTSAAPGQA
ncbi:TRAP transporter small permease subunit [Aurantimonas aggregata]|uniref:TRAP transporter small permease protein n=1 Tax=Aurantimonas aggregata TaxID=2047720 RepID=A0A6L9MD92_9HYPH|nr:TRAP transporter small permease [Aurantimonas aggregata]NDV85765.1 TRAP transporter small permease subunit [Aurantimonas aggregata]